MLLGFAGQAQTNPNPNNECGVFAPNAFTPNRDNTNDEFRVLVAEACEPLEYRLRVFDRYGRLVFESINPTESWDGSYNGRQLKEGVYLWHLLALYTVPSGQETTRLEEKGSVVLMR
jgi:gliding motility-associated-like protein